MSSTLTYQLRQQQEDNKHDGNQVTNLPSPPNSSCGDETTTTITNTNSVSTTTTSTTTIDNNNNIIPTINTPTPTPQQLQQRRDSLQSHFSTLTLQAISNSLPENYTIDHSSIKASLQQALNNTTKNLTPNNNNNNINNNNNNNTIKASSPIPIENTPVRRNGATITNNGSYRPESPMPSQHLSPASIAAGTGGLTIRHRRPSTIDYRNKKGNSYLSESPNTNNSLLKSSTSLPSNASHNHGQQYRCEDCGKIYKHPSCLTKHKWEHSEEWELTSKFLLTKHQQVQMLEAAAILVSMDNNGAHNSLPTTSTGSPLLNNHLHQQSYNNNNNDTINTNNNDNMNMNTDSDDNDDESIHIDDDDESIHIDDDDDDISIEMDQDEGDQSNNMNNTQHTTFPSMIGSTPAMLPSSFATNTV